MLPSDRQGVDPIGRQAGADRLTRRRERRGFTLVEIVVGVGVGGLVLVLVWGLVSTMTRGFASSRDLLTSLQGAHLLVEYLKNDLASVYFDPTTHPIDNPNAYELAFFVFDPEDNGSIDISNPRAVLEKVSYKFDRDANQVIRNGEPMLFASFEEARFGFIPPKFNQSPKKYGNYVVIRVTCASDKTIAENRTRSKGDRLTRNVVTLITAVSVQQKASMEIFPLWSRPGEPTVEVR